jgi:hypothetical protein
MLSYYISDILYQFTLSFPPSPHTMRAFNVAPDGATVTFNRNLGQNWRVTLGGNRTLKIGNMERGQEINILLQQDETGNRSVVWPAAVKWATGVAPTLQADAGAVDMFTFRYDGTYLHEVSGSGVQAINKVLATALATVTVALGAVGVTMYVTGNPGQVSDAVQQYTSTGGVNTLVYRRLGSGGILISGSGEGLAIVNNLRATGTGSKVSEGVFQVNKDGVTIPTLGQAGNAYVACFTSGGILGVCSTTPTDGKCTCARP